MMAHHAAVKLGHLFVGTFIYMSALIKFKWARTTINDSDLLKTQRELLAAICTANILLVFLCRTTIADASSQQLSTTPDGLSI